ncbi:MAG: glycosyltransferase [Parvularculaceae bacterium]|nr:glycosyltransferase [Parvularculaceae bacterium]
MSSPGEISISVVMPAYRAAHYLERALPPLIALRDKGEVREVIVVDDCSPEPSTNETARRLGATVLVMKANAGPGAARNLAARHASGDILWLVDADVIAHDSGPEKIRTAFCDPTTGAVFGSYDNAPPERNFASTYKNLVHRYYHQRAREDSESFWSGCGAVRRDVYFDVGGFDEQRFGRPAIEDVELGHRIRKAGWKIRLLPKFLGTHLKRWTLPEIIRTDIFQRAVPWSYLILSGRGVKNDLNVSTAERVRAAVAGFWALSILSIFAFWPLGFIAFLTLTGLVAAINAPLFVFFLEERGGWFAFRAVLYHQVYYLYSSATFAICALKFRFGGAKDHVVAAAREPAAAE